MILLFSLVGCGSKTEGPDVRKDPTVPPQTQNQSPPSPDLETARRDLLILKTYVRLRDGVPPNSDHDQNRKNLAAYSLAFSMARDANYAIAQRSGPQCRRFIALYNGVNSQLVEYFTLLLSTPPPNLKTVRFATVRLQILQFFERALFGLILVGAEAGESGLDDSFRSQCESTDRRIWTNLLLRTHQTMEIVSEGVLGVPSAMAIADESANWREVNTQFSYDRTVLQVGWFIGEVAASIVLWEKGISPFLRIFVSTAQITPMGRLITYGAGVIYVLGWVAFDRSARETLPFLKPTPKIFNRQTVSRWNEIVRLGEEFLVSNLTSPPLYFAYVELLSLLRKEAAMHFLTQHEADLERVEHDYGSIEKATEKLKEVLRHENSIHRTRSDSRLGDGRLATAG